MRNTIWVHSHTHTHQPNVNDEFISISFFLRLSFCSCVDVPSDRQMRAQWTDQNGWSHPRIIFSRATIPFFFILVLSVSHPEKNRAISTKRIKPQPIKNTPKKYAMHTKNAMILLFSVIVQFSPVQTYIILLCTHKLAIELRIVWVFFLLAVVVVIVAVLIEFHEIFPLNASWCVW